MQVQPLGWEDPLEEGTLTHSSILACIIPWTEEPGRLHTVCGVEKSRHNWATEHEHTCMYTHTHTHTHTHTSGHLRTRATEEILLWDHSWVDSLLQLLGRASGTSYSCPKQRLLPRPSLLLAFPPSSFSLPGSSFLLSDFEKWAGLDREERTHSKQKERQSEDQNKGRLERHGTRDITVLPLCVWFRVKLVTQIVGQTDTGTRHTLVIKRCKCGKGCVYTHAQFVTLWTVIHWASQSKRFFRQEYWSGLPFPPPGDLPDPGIKPVTPVSPASQVDSLPLSHQAGVGKITKQPGHMCACGSNPGRGSHLLGCSPVSSHEIALPRLFMA